MSAGTRVVITALAIIIAAVGGSAMAAERLDRGLVAVPVPGGDVYLSWRMLIDDPGDVAFNVYRCIPGRTGYQRVNAGPITATTDFTDPATKPGTAYSYRVRAIVRGREGSPSRRAPVTTSTEGGAYIPVRLQGEYQPQRVTMADLDGDGELEYVLKQPNFNVDPYSAPGYWKRSQDTYKIEAYDDDGSFMWRYDMGWAIEEGTWYSPYVVYDLDGDGKAEVATKAGEGDPRQPDGHVTSGPEYLVLLDGHTGKVKAKTDWLTREGFRDYNRYCRNFLAVAYLDGRRPSLIMQRGTYRIIKTAALDANLKQQWYWEASGPDEAYQAQGAHTLVAADIDADGRDELVIGSAAIDENGRSLWTVGLGHPDVIHVTDIDPTRPGLEVFYGIEPRRPKNAVCLVDARTGEIIWGYDGPTKHVHGQGMAGDIDAAHPGVECYAGEKDASNYWLYSAKGERISDEKLGGLTPRVAYWDADPQREIVLGGRMREYNGREYGAIEGRVIAVADCLGDWREEVITTVPGEMRIYTTTIPATTRRVCLMQDRLYRMGVVRYGTGYPCPPQEGGPPLRP